MVGTTISRAATDYIKECGATNALAYAKHYRDSFRALGQTETMNAYSRIVEEIEAAAK